MATISSAGIGSGLNVNDLVNQLVTAERKPTDDRLNALESTTKAQITAFGALKSALSGLQDALNKLNGNGALPGRKTTVQDGAGFTATAGATAALGSYSVIVNQLASAHKLQSAAAASNTQIGYGTLTFQVGSDPSFDVTIDAGKGTLADIRDAINTQAAGKGVAATLVRGDAGDVLVLTSTKSGSGGAMTITASGGDGGLSVLNTTGGTLTQVTPAQDAQIQVDGVTRTYSGNTLTDVIDGVTLNLTKAQPGQSYTLSVESDASTLKASVLGFISAYNTAVNAIRTQSAAGGQGKVAGPLSGDSTARNILQSLRSTLGQRYAELSALGLKTATDGTLTLDGSKFDAATTANPAAVKDLFAETSDLGKNLRDVLTGYLGNQGLLESRSKGLNDRMQSIQKNRDDLDARMEKLADTYRRQFTALDAMMAQMQSTSTYIAQQLGAISPSR